MKDLGAEEGKLDGLSIRNLRQNPRFRNQARVGRHDTIDVGPDPNLVSVQGGAHNRTAVIGRAPTERGASPGAGSAAKAGDDRNHSVPPQSCQALAGLGVGFIKDGASVAELIVTDDHFGNAAPIFDETNAKTRQRLAGLRRRGIVPVITGFRGATRAGACTTLGRGGSDYSGTIVGAALDADEVWIWTDVDGVMTTDPRLVPEARILPEISYREAIELSFFGAKVLHPKTIQPVMKKKIPVWIKNSFNPACPGTCIVPAAANSQRGVKAITHVSKAHIITLTGKESLSFPQLAAKAFGSLSLGDIPTLMVTQSSADNILCFAVHDADLRRVKAQLEKTFELEMLHDDRVAIEIMPHVAIVVMIGEHMKGTPGLSGRAFSSLGRRGINVIAIAQGSSELSISFAVKAPDVKEAVKAIHEEFALGAN